MQKTVGFISLGCPKNLVDSEVMMGILESKGFRLVADPSKAQVLIINTCGFVEDAKKESIDAIIEMGSFTKDPDKRLIVTGCLPQRYKEKMKDLFPEVDLFVGTGEYHRIDKLLSGLLKKSSRTGGDVIAGVPQYIHDALTPRRLSTSRHSVYVKVAEGCSHGCAFCIIPKLRGKYRSRPLNDVVKETSALIDNGAREVNLIAQDTTAYGKDLRDGTSLTKLLEKLGGLKKKDVWYRVMYAHPAYFDDAMIEAIRDIPQVCKYIDIPIQHINDRILKSMGRKEGGREVRRLVERLKKAIPDIVLRTTLIVGYPSETKREFEELKSFVKEGLFDRLGVFAYSKEDGTRAAKLPRQVSQKEKEARRDTIMQIQREISMRKNSDMLGKKVTAMLDGYSEETDLLLVARTQHQAPEIDGVIYINETSKGKYRPGDFVTVEVTEAYEYDLVGKIVSKGHSR